MQVTDARIPSVEPARGEPAAHEEEVQRDVDVLFEEWKEQEAHVDLSDLRWQDALVFLIFWGLFAVVFLQFYTCYVLNSSLGCT